MLHYTGNMCCLFPSLHNLLALAICLRSSPPLLVTSLFLIPNQRYISAFHSRCDTLHKGVTALWRTTVPCHRDSKMSYQVLTLLAPLQLEQKYEPQTVQFRKLWHSVRQIFSGFVVMLYVKNLTDSRKEREYAFQVDSLLSHMLMWGEGNMCWVNDTTHKLCTAS